MHRFLAIFLGMVLVGAAGLGCQGPSETDAPKPTLPDSVLVSLLVDLHVYESALQTRGGSLELLPTPRSATFLKEKYGYDQETVRRELANLLQQPERGDTIMGQVVRRIKELQAALPAPQTPTIGLTDRRADEAAALLPTDPVRPTLPEHRGSGSKASAAERVKKFSKALKGKTPEDASGN